MSEKNLRFIMMSCGYVEMAKVSWLIFQCGPLGHHDGYSSYKEAITDLALDQYARYSESKKPYLDKDCCRETVAKDKTAKFCSACGRIIHHGFDEEDFMDYVRQIHNDDCDSYGDSEWANGRSLKWWAYWGTAIVGAPKEEVIIIAESAEVVLRDALYEAKPELRSDDGEVLRTWYETDWEKFMREEQPTYG